MSNPSKRKGTAWENEVREMLREVFPNAERAPSWGVNDKGDFTGTGPFTVEAKACKSIDLASFVDEATVEAVNSGNPLPVVFVKRRMKPARSGYVVMPASAWLTLVKLLRLPC